MIGETIISLANALLHPKEKDPTKRNEERQRIHDALLKNVDALISLAEAAEDYALALESTVAAYPSADSAEPVAEK